MLMMLNKFFLSKRQESNFGRGWLILAQAGLIKVIFSSRSWSTQPFSQPQINKPSQGFFSSCIIPQPYYLNRKVLERN